MRLKRTCACVNWHQADCESKNILRNVIAMRPAAAETYQSGLGVEPKCASPTYPGQRMDWCGRVSCYRPEVIASCLLHKAPLPWESCIALFAACVLSHAMIQLSVGRGRSAGHGMAWLWRGMMCL